MFKIKSKDFLTGAELEQKELLDLIDFSHQLKKERADRIFTPYLQGQHLAILFDKPSLRTRFSFSVGMQQLGGMAVESLGDNRKNETPADTVRVLEGYVDALMYRTFSHEVLEKMAAHSKIPIINGLSDTHHPCQAIADLLTLKEEFGQIEGKTLTYIGDGNNVLHSLMVLLPMAGVNVRYICPEGHQPSEEVLALVEKVRSKCTGVVGRVEGFTDLSLAVSGVHALYTDVWASMGQEEEAEKRRKIFNGLQLNEELLKKADPKCIVLHCMPMKRGEEISATLPEHMCSRIYDQCENRLHAQKALMVGLMVG